MDIKHSRRILAVGAPNAGVLHVIKDLTGSVPVLNENGSTAGLTHEWDVQTPYYTAKVPIWIDEIVQVEEWKSEFLKPEAKEVVDAVGAWVFCFRKPRDEGSHAQLEAVMKAIQQVSEEHAGYGADVVMLAVAVPHQTSSQHDPDASLEDLEDTCIQYGFELIDYAAKGTNEFGEKTGFERLKEALEANEWTDTGADDHDGDIDDLGLDEDDEREGFARDEAEMTAELFGMKAALMGEDFEPEADDFESPKHKAGEVEDLDRLMGKLLAVKEQSADLPAAQRKRMAAKAIRDIFNED